MTTENIIAITRKRKNPLPTLVLGIICATLVIIARLPFISTTIPFCGIFFSYTDLFVILAAGIGGLSAGILCFSILFIAEFFRISGSFTGLYALSTYLVIIFISSRLSYDRMFINWKRTLRSCILLSIVLALCWHITFTLLMPAFNITDANDYRDIPFLKLLISAVPECGISSLILYLFFRFMPDEIKLKTGSGWLYTKDYEERLKNGEARRKYVLGLRLTMLTIGEALLLCLVAILFSNIQATISMGERFSLEIVIRLWPENLQLTLTMFCAAIPLSFLFNKFILNMVVAPINEMSFLMERYYEDDEGSNGKRMTALPDLGIKSGDEIEKLYKSLQKMVGDAAVYIERIIKQEQKSAHLTQGFMLALAKAVDAKDHYTSGHSERVAQYAREIAHRMGKTQKELDDIYTMGLLHDIGKIGVSEAIINKNGRLTDEEFAEIKTHPAKGYEILQNVTELPALATGARWHHERYDGRGYPDGLSGATIPEEARIIAVADAYDAMTSKRAYSDVRPQEQVRAEIERCKGSQFDPAIADIMLSMIDDDTEYKMHEGA